MQPWIYWVFGGLLGAALGSFVSATLSRIKSGTPLSKPSHCDLCGKNIPPWRNIPILTWIIQRGHGHCCKAPIGWSVLAWETGMTLVGVLVGAFTGMTGMIVFPLVLIPGALLVWFVGTKRR